jgi:hypothetical protein
MLCVGLTLIIIFPANAARLALPPVPYYTIEPLPLPQPAAPPRYTEHDSGSETAANQEHNKSDHPKTFWEGFTNDPVARATLLLTGVTAILAVSTIGLWITTSRSVKIAERALTELERAYVFPSITDIHGPEAVSFRIRLRSLGRTPAIIKEVAVKFNGNAPLIGKPDMEMSGLVVAIQDFDWAINDTEWTEFFHSPCAGEQHFFGFVRYFDIFNKEHLSWFGIYLDAAGKTYRAGGQEYNSWD